jgi:Tfp pilus assembly protein PilV
MKLNSHLKDQSGIASLMITMVMMIVISLIVLGFAQVSRREQKNTLDRQLSTQAFYAAETGINDAQNAINNAAGKPIISKTTCGGNGGNSSIYDGKLNYTVNASQNVTYTCLLVSTRVPDLQKTLGVDQEWVVPVSPVDSDGSATAISQLTFSWPPQDSTIFATTGCPGSSGGHIQNPDSNGWNNCGYGALRIDIVPVSPSQDPSRQDLEASDMVVFAYPSNSGSGLTYSYSNGVNASTLSHQAGATCNTGGVHTCKLTIDNLPSQNGMTYYVRVHMLYRSSGTDIVKINGSSSSVLFTGAQAQIDSTGKAQDVLRRVRVTVPLAVSANDYSPYALLTQDSICKRYTVAPGIAPSNQIPAGNAADTANPTCQSGAGGDAKIGDYNCVTNCSSIDPAKWYFDFYRPNASSNADSIVAGCTWDWGDGTTTGTPTTLADDCYSGHYAYHVMHDSNPNPTTIKPSAAWCHYYTVTLTEYFKNGFAPAVYPYSAYFPYGNPSCS